MINANETKGYSVSVGKGSWWNTPNMVVDLGDILEKPRVESRKRLAALLNQSKAVRSSRRPQQTEGGRPSRTQMPPLVMVQYPTSTKATGVISSVSATSPTIGETDTTFQTIEGERKHV